MIKLFRQRADFVLSLIVIGSNSGGREVIDKGHDALMGDYGYGGLLQGGGGRGEEGGGIELVHFGGWGERSDRGAAGVWRGRGGRGNGKDYLKGKG